MLAGLVLRKKERHLRRRRREEENLRANAFVLRAWLLDLGSEVEDRRSELQTSL